MAHSLDRDNRQAPTSGPGPETARLFIMRTTSCAAQMVSAGPHCSKEQAMLAVQRVGNLIFIKTVVPQ
jgi:hypothetical protein